MGAHSAPTWTEASCRCGSSPPVSALALGKAEARTTDRLSLARAVDDAALPPIDSAGVQRLEHDHTFDASASTQAMCNRVCRAIDFIFDR